MLEVVLRDLAAEGGSGLVGAEEVEADQDARPVDVLDHVAEPVVVRVVPVMRLSSEKCTLSVPKKERSALVTAPLWQAWAEGYSGKFGVAPSGCQVGSASVFGFPSVSARGIAW